MGGGAWDPASGQNCCQYATIYSVMYFSVDGFDFGFVLSLEETRAPHYRTVSGYM